MTCYNVHCTINIALALPRTSTQQFEMLHRKIQPALSPSTGGAAAAASSFDDMDVDANSSRIVSVGVAQQCGAAVAAGANSTRIHPSTSSSSVPSRSDLRPSVQTYRQDRQDVHKRQRGTDESSNPSSTSSQLFSSTSSHLVPVPTFQDTVHPTVPEIVPVTLPSVGSFRTIASVLKLSDVRAESGSEEELFERYRLPTRMSEVRQLTKAVPQASESLRDQPMATSACATDAGSSAQLPLASRFSWDPTLKVLSITDSLRQAPPILVNITQAKSGSMTGGKILEILTAIGSSDFPRGANVAERWSKYTKSSKKDILVACLAQRLDTLVELLSSAS